ncbi:MAG: alpha-amylase family glycosyl hydrolase [Bacteroidia bacterium]
MRITLQKFLFSFICLISWISNSNAQTTYWWNEKVFYEIYVRSFYDSNGNGTGDFNGVTAKLDYLNDGNPNTKTDLGVEAIWLMPINASPSVHGYDVTNYKTVNPVYGTAADFKNLVNEAHKRGIKIVMDFVINHSSEQHPWFVKSAAKDPAYRDYYRWSPTKPTYVGPWGQNVWHQKNNEYYYGIFWSGMPDLNYENKAVKDSIFDAAHFWLDSMNVDGFRLDAAMYLYENGSNLMNLPQTIEFWKNFDDTLENFKAEVMTVGEVWTTSSTVVNYNNKLDYCFDFDIAQSALEAANTGALTNLKKSVKFAYDNYPFLQFGTFLTNHDQNRVIDVLGNDIRKNKVAASIYLTIPGIPYLYYGEEVAMKGSKPDEYIRRPMQWTSSPFSGFTSGTAWFPLNSNYASFNVNTLKADSNSIWHHYRKLIQLRNSEKALRTGTYKSIFSDNAKTFAFIRQKEEDHILSLINCGADTISRMSLSVSNANLSSGVYLATDLLSGKNTYVEITTGLAITGLSMLPFETKLLKLSIASGLMDARNEMIIQLYPNPAEEYFDLSLSDKTDNIDIKIFDLTGSLVENQTWELLEGQTKRIQIANLKDGIYLVQLKDKNKQKTIRFVKTSH